MRKRKTNSPREVNSVPNGTTGKGELQTRLDNITSVTSPEVNDVDSNGVLDTITSCSECRTSENRSRYEVI
ncbi:GA-like domain-containing protein [Staphylococcus ureilyticus]|uniref:GA-like domain-containing protein n=1 Tax=Staphylococcus ureilyticus TaxID=94138 RepID=UPI003F690D1A